MNARELMKARAGQALVEYVLVIALVAVALLASILLLRHAVGGRIDHVSEAIASPATAGENPPPGTGDGDGNGNGKGNPGKGDPPGKGKNK